MNKRSHLLHDRAAFIRRIVRCDVFLLCFELASFAKPHSQCHLEGQSSALASSKFKTNKVNKHHNWRFYGWKQLFCEVSDFVYLLYIEKYISYKTKWSLKDLKKIIIQNGSIFTNIKNCKLGGSSKISSKHSINWSISS